MHSRQTLGDAWRHGLPLSHRIALADAATALLDHCFGECLGHARHGMTFADSYVGWLLPRKHAPSYDARFARRFILCLEIVIWKLAQAHPCEPLCACTAEELALHALIQEASGILGVRQITADFSDFMGTAFEDLDVLLLHQPDLDGAEIGPAASALDIGRIRFADWFSPFCNAATAVHPYAAVDWGDSEEVGV